MELKTFLTPAEVAELTGVSRGKRVQGKSFTREELQLNWLRQAGIPFFENVRGRPIISRAVIEGSKVFVSTPRKTGWQPNALVRS